MRFLKLKIMALFLVAAALFAQNKTALIDTEMASRVGEGEPGFTLLLAENGEIVFEKAYGLADMETGRANDVNTKFRIGSVTKQFTAAAILKLQEMGKLNVKDELSDYYPEIPGGDAITLHMLLTHTSGLKSYTDLPDFIEKVTGPVTPEQIIAAFKDVPVEFQPGQGWKYCNSGFFLLGQIVEKVSGESYGDYLKEHFFKPLKMKDTGVHKPGLDLKNEAMGHVFLENEFQKALDWNMDWAGGAGAIYSTVGDLFKWTEGLHSGKILKPESLKAMLTPVSTEESDSPAAQVLQGYGYGIGVGSYKGMKRISHGGGLHGFVSDLAYYPEKGVTVAVLANAAPGKSVIPGQISAKAADIWFGLVTEEKEDVTVAAEDLEKYVGKYQYPGNAILYVTLEDGHLFAQLTGQPRFEIFPKGDHVFAWKVVEAQITFVVNKEGVVTGGIHHQAGAELKVAKIEE